MPVVALCIYFIVLLQHDGRSHYDVDTRSHGRYRMYRVICTEYVTDCVKSLCVHICLYLEKYHFEIINQPCQANWQCLIRRTIISFLLIGPYTTNLASQMLADFGLFWWGMHQFWISVGMKVRRWEGLGAVDGGKNTQKKLNNEIWLQVLEWLWCALVPRKGQYYTLHGLSWCTCVAVFCKGIHIGKCMHMYIHMYIEFIN